MIRYRKRKRTMIKRIKKHFLIYFFAVAAVFSLAAGDNYFEISKNLEIFADIYKTLDLYYVDEINPNELIRTGIDAMLASLDPYTNFYSEAELENYRFQTTGKYGGLGMLIVLPESEVASATDLLGASGETVYAIGTISAGDGRVQIDS